MQQNLHTLFQKEMTRKEFLAVLGFGVASIFGFSTIIKLLTSKSNPLHRQADGYGGSDYGGKSLLNK